MINNAANADLQGSLRGACFGLAVLVFVAVAPAFGADCNTNGIDDACDLDCGTPGGPCDLPGCGLSTDCNTNAVPDECDLSGGASQDCDGNAIPDECDMALGASGCAFTYTLSQNTTGADNALFIGPPDDVFYGLGGQIVTYHFDCATVVDGPGPDLTLYEVDSGTAEFNYVEKVEVSHDGVTFFDIKWTEGPAINIPGDEQHGSNSYARSYNLDPSLPRAVRYVRIDGTGTGAAGSNYRFDLDALGAATRIGRDCDGSGTLDVCESLADCNANGIPDTCEMSAGLDPDCNANGTIDECDVLSLTSLDCNANLVPDECEPDCNTNTVPDECDITGGSSADCNQNGVPDSCDLAVTTYTADSGPLLPVGYGMPAEFMIPSAFAAGTDVTVSVDAVGDFDATTEYLDVSLNGTNVGRVLDSASTHCSSTVDSLVIPVDIFNDLVQGGDATFGLTAPSAVSRVECVDPTVVVTVTYDALVDCNTSGTLDYCDIDTGGSTDLNLNGIADDCETDCNANGAPDDYDIEQGTSGDCNSNQVPDECDTSTGTSLDCNANSVPDECEPDCNTNGIPDECDITVGTSLDCDLNTVPDECDMAVGAGGCSFPLSLSENATGAADDRFVGPPDDIYYGLGGQIVTYELDCGFIYDGPGLDITVYELDSGTPEFNLVDVLVSEDGVSFASVKATETTAVNIPGDEQHGSNNYARSYDLDGSGIILARFVRLDGSGSGSAGSSAGFDLDAIGVINKLGRDCDSSGTLDLCEGLNDCDGNLLPDICEIVLTGDCNTNGVPDDCDLAGASTDCNHNGLLDECDIAAGTSQDCDNNGLPDECPNCPGGVEVVYVMDMSTSMDDEGAALCSKLPQVAADLEEDLVTVQNVLMGIPYAGTGIYDCLELSVAGEHGTTVPENPPPDNEILGDCPGGLQSPTEDWGRAVSIVAWERSWAGGSVKLIVPLSDEGPWCGDPVSDPGVDRDSVVHAIGLAQQKNVRVSPVTCSGSSGGVITLQDQLATATGGERFASTLPAEDLADGLKGIINDACDSATDCNHNDVPDVCELAAGTSQDCDNSGIPDECEADCNGNGYHDSCDISWGTSQDANANTVPDECEAIELMLGSADLTWTAVDGAIGYDVVWGDLAVLTANSGNFTMATYGCTANDHASTTFPHTPQAPGPGEALWFLVRGVLGTMDLSYDVFSPTQAAPRDAAIDASASSCP
jgi:hypothetical protein